ncbi:MAG: hypothetical protein ACOY4O_10320 [Pseudomonadota bacterium]
MLRAARLMMLALWLLLAGGQPAAAQMFQCPPGSVSVSGGGGMMCQCADGSFASIYGCAPLQQQTAPQPQVGDYCSNGATCPIGYHCSRIPGHCVPNGQVDCGHYSCQPGSFCGSGNTCLAQGSDDCGDGKSCKPGTTCSRNRSMCVADGSVDCGSFTCPNGSKCARERRACLAADTVDCGSFDCRAGSKCGSGNQCLAQTAIDCGGGKSCPAGNVCVKGGEECLTPQQVTQREEETKKKKAEAIQRAKEVKSAEDFIKREKVRIAAEDKKKAAEAKKKQEEEAKLAAKQKADDVKRAADAAKQKPKDDDKAASGISAQPGAKPAEGAALNSNLKDIQSITSNPPSKPGTAQSASTAPPKDPTLNCSTFRNPTGDATIGPDGCPKPGYESKKPFTQPPPQELQRANQTSTKPDQAKSKFPQRHLVEKVVEDCSGDFASRAYCEHRGGGRRCNVTRITMSCEKGLFGMDADCQESSRQAPFEICKN